MRRRLFPHLFGGDSRRQFDEIRQSTPISTDGNVRRYVNCVADAIVALAMDLIWGFTGILSLGHGVFFALGFDPLVLEGRAGGEERRQGRDGHGVGDGGGRAV